MDFSRFHTGIVARVLGLAATLAALNAMIAYSHWYVAIALTLGAALIQVLSLIRFSTRSGQEVARFLDAITFDDASVSFAGLTGDPAFAELGAAMTRVLGQVRLSRAEREEQGRYLQALVAHVPVALVTIDNDGGVQLLNLAARRLFERPCARTAEFARYGAEFAAALEALRPGESRLVRMERRDGALQLKAAATGITLRGVRRYLVSLQNIETELTAHQLAAWQSVIRIMAHEVTNSLTPIASLAETARHLVADLRGDGLTASDRAAHLIDADEALETLARRSEGLSHFVQNHRRLTRRMEASPVDVPLSRVFARLQRLMADEFASRDIRLELNIRPPDLKVTADAELLDQALINLMRNAMDAVRDRADAIIILSAEPDGEDRVAIMVDDNGPGIPAHLRDKVFVPFFTTRRDGNGVGLTLVRQIAMAHGGSVQLSEAPLGGARVRLRL
jgi:nitrogen fixation/metabolism regulation signal transduction histidine kinase